MLAWSERSWAWLCLALVVGASCSVFPDEATLPARPNGAGSAGQGLADDAGSNAGGQGNVVNLEGGAAGQVTGGSTGTGGSSGSGGSVPSLGGAGGEPSVVGGAGGEGGAAPCNNPQTVRVAATDDTWIGSAKPSMNHASDKFLSVVSGADEHRALIALTVPQMLLGAQLRGAVLRLHLESNADAGLAVRRLGVHQLTSPFEEGRATWVDNVKNSQWTNKGGDFGSALASARIAPGTSSGNVDFNLTATIGQILGPTPIPLSLIVVESTAARPAPAELAFTATEGNASQIPELLLTYCDP